MQAEITLRQAAQQALEALEPDCELAEWYVNELREKAIAALRAALAEPEQEPDGISWLKRDSGYFTAPTPSKPLTDEEIDKLPWGPHEGNPMTFAEGLRDFARAIERAHGIGEQHE